MQSSLVSIVMPAYNAEAFLLDAVKSIQLQSYVHWELIIIDDCSTDGTRDLMEVIRKNDARIKVIYLSKNAGVANARNVGIRLSDRAHFLAFLDADDLWMPTRLEKQILLAENEKNAPLFYTGYEFVNNSGKPSGVAVHVPKAMSLKEAYGNHLIWTSTVLINLRTVKLEDVFMVEISFGEDILTWWKLLSKYGEAYGVNETLALYRRGGKSLSSNKFKILSKKWQLFSYINDLTLSMKAYYYMQSLYNAARKRI